jgi:MFS family permease
MQTRTPLASWYALATLSVVTLYALIDAQVLGLLAQSMKIDLHLSDTQLGSLRGMGAALFGAIAVLPIGWLADRTDRRLLLAMCVLVWSAAVASCGLATGYWGLMASMAFLAAGEAGLTPVVYSMIPELFAERQRMTANFVFYAATVLAGGVGFGVAGLVINHIGLLARWVPVGQFTHETWRLVLFVVAVPGPLLALAIALIRLKRAARPANAQAAAPQVQRRPELLGYLVSHWKSLVGVFGPVALTLMGAGAVFTWLPVILTRVFALTAGDVGVGLGAAIGTGSVAGLLVAGAAARLLLPRWGAATPIRLSRLGYAVFALLIPLYLVARSPSEMFLIAGVQMGAMNSGNALMPTVLQGIAPASLRGRVFAIAAMSAALVQVISPIAVGLLSDHVFSGDRALLLSSVTFGTPCLALAALTIWIAEKHILGTMDAVSDRSTQLDARDAGSADRAVEHAGGHSLPLSSGPGSAG